MKLDTLLTRAGFKQVSSRAVSKVEAALGRKLDANLRALFGRAAGEYLGGHSFVRVFETDEFTDVRSQRALHHVPGIVFFASDDGDGFYGVDEDDRVLWVDRGAPKRAKQCERALSTFVAKTLEGEKWLWVRVPDDESDVGLVLDAAPGAWKRSPVEGGLRAASERCNVRLWNGPLEPIYERTNGLSAGEVSVRRHDRIEPVEGVFVAGTTFAGAVWFADAPGRRFAFVTADTKSVREGDVIEVANGASPDGSVRLGTLVEVMGRWLATPKAKKQKAR